MIAPGKAKIIGTIGPASKSEAVIRQLLQAGLNVARLNFSHGTHEEHAAYIATIRKVAAELDTTVAILQDLQGPKIRVGKLDNPITLKQGEQVILFAEEDPLPEGTEQKIPVAFEEIFKSVQVGDGLLLDDGRLKLKVESTTPRSLKARVELGRSAHLPQGHKPARRAPADSWFHRKR